MKPDISLLLRLILVLVFHSRRIQNNILHHKIDSLLEKIQKFSWLAGSNPTVFTGQTTPHPTQILSEWGMGGFLQLSPKDGTQEPEFYHKSKLVVG